MKFFNENKALFVSFFIILVAYPVMPFFGHIIAVVTGYEGLLLIAISFLISVPLCMFPYIMDIMEDKTEKRKERLNKALLIIVLTAIVLFVFYVLTNLIIELVA